MTDDNPWLGVSEEDYEAHMDAVGQSAILRDLFHRVYAERRPARLAILGCTTCRDLLCVDPDITETAVGVDINSAYLEIAAERLKALGPRLRLVHGDVLSVELPVTPFDLIHAALLLEYVEPLALFRRVHRWLAPGGTFSVVTQVPVEGAPVVSRSDYPSLQSLAGCMSLRHPDQVTGWADQAGFRRGSTREAALPDGKVLVSTLFEKADGATSVQVT